LTNCIGGFLGLAELSKSSHVLANLHRLLLDIRDRQRSFFSG
jgi:hypothetical protein